jgi:hypothetical protein
MPPSLTDTSYEIRAAEQPRSGSPIALLAATRYAVMMLRWDGTSRRKLDYPNLAAI